jgi:hypothetical protein
MEYILYGYGTMAILVIALIVAATVLVRRRRRIRAERAAEATRQALLQKQQQMGRDTFLSLMSAARRNFAHPLVLGSREGIKVIGLSNNGGRYSIVVNRGEVNQWHGKFEPGILPILQLDICVEKNEIHAFYGAFGPDRYWPLSQLDAVIRELDRYIINYPDSIKDAAA